MDGDPKILQDMDGRAPSGSSLTGGDCLRLQRTRVKDFGTPDKGVTRPSTSVLSVLQLFALVALVLASWNAGILLQTMYLLEVVLYDSLKFASGSANS
ncbi:hypothetical protein AVEN_61759-1 [Araneus ventricosus]|uniref:Uncharacterized protein n=1 Tax=Araneus ventricosus TaxID=182803 RepID=A0A4Y2MG49_ARAVE|nr:hypothetical protein AVEN_61759-1 [Araneus ventricosus]